MGHCEMLLAVAGLDKDAITERTQRLASGELLFEHIARLAAGPWNANGQLGLVVGATNAKGERPVGQPYTPQNVLATIYRHLGIDLQTTIPDHSGRPVHLLDDTTPIKELG